MLPVALTCPPVSKLAPEIFAALVIVLVALINPAVKIFAPTRLPVVLTRPLEVTLVNVPTLVIFGCALVVTVPAVTAEVTLPETLAPCILLIVLPLPINWPAVTVPVALINPAVLIFAPVILPVDTKALDAKSNVNPVDPAKLPLLL